MKRVLLMTALCALAALLRGAPAERVAWCTVAPFDDLAKKTGRLGAMVENHIVAQFLQGMAEETLKAEYGPFRRNAPLHVFVYREPGTLEGANEVELIGSLQTQMQSVLVYPNAGDPAKTAALRPGAEMDADGLLHLLPRVGHPEDRWMKFTKDGRYYAISESRELVRRALDDLERDVAARPPAEGEAPLLEVGVEACGLSLALELQDRLVEVSDAGAAAKAAQRAENARRAVFLRSLTNVRTQFDVRKTGVTVDLLATPRPDAKPLPAAGFRLPAGALDCAPAGAPLFLAVNASLADCYYDERDFRADVEAQVRLFREEGLPELRKALGDGKHLAFATELQKRHEEMVHRLPAPAPTDWCTVALGVDANRGLYLHSYDETAKSAEATAAVNAFFDGMAAAADRQWPDRKLVARASPDSVVFDLGHCIDAAVAESKDAAVKPEDIQKIKDCLALLLGGGTRLAVTLKARAGGRGQTLVAREGFVPPSAPSDAEAALAAALPETQKDRPSGVCFFRSFELVREVLLPFLEKVSSPEDAAAFKAMRDGMVKARPDGAIASAGWYRKDGSLRVLTRITAAEVQNYGQMLNQLISKALTAGAGGDDDDDDDDK